MMVYNTWYVAAWSSEVGETIEIAFDEDFVILEAQQKSMDRFAVTDDVHLAIAAAPTVQRRIVKRLYTQETVSTPPIKTAP